MIKVATIINYCTTDYRFLKFCIEEAKKFSQQIVVPVCSHFFNGEPENRALLNQSYQEHPDVQFVEFAYEEEPYGIYCPLTSSDEDWAHYWHSTARYVGFHYVQECDYVLFLDVDEIVDGLSFSSCDLKGYDAVRLPSYFYFREPIYRAMGQYPLNALLVRKAAIESPEMILDVFERKGLYDQIQGRKIIDQRRFVHHYSWVRTKPELIQKVRTWGHRYDREWLELIEKEFSQPFAGTDRIHGFGYETVDRLHDVLQNVVEKDHSEAVCQNVTKVDRRSLFHLELKKHYEKAQS